jgi:hypothetical protein
MASEKCRHSPLAPPPAAPSLRLQLKLKWRASAPAGRYSALWLAAMSANSPSRRAS